MNRDDPGPAERHSSIDDDEEVRRATAELLEALGFTAEAVGNDRLALERLQSPDPASGLIILDLRMPVMDGSEFGAEQRRLPELRSIPVVLVTADSRAEEWAVLLGVDGCLRKPVGPQDLVLLARRYCAESRTEGAGGAARVPAKRGMSVAVLSRAAHESARCAVAQGGHMIGLALLSLVAAVVAGILGFTGLAGAAAWIAQIVFVIGLVAFVVLLVLSRRGHDTVP
jgi:CheY-like chemotaxis protein